MTGSRARAGFVLAAALTVSCGGPLVKLPAGPGSPATDAADALREATMGCRAVSTFTSEMSVGGAVGGRRVRGRLLVGLAPPASVRLEAVAPFGQPLFFFISRDGETTLLLPRDNRVMEHGASRDVLDAVAGVPLGAADLRVALTGCTTVSDSSAGQQLGADWRVVSDGPGELHLHRDPHGAPWRLVAAVHRDAGRSSWRAEYRDFENGLPRTIRLASLDAGRFDLRLTLSQVAINEPLDASAFTLRIPAGAAPITLDELRRTGPLAAP